MDVTTKPAQGYSDWNANITGTPSAWQTAIHWGQGGQIPYTQYEDWFDGSSSTTAAHDEGYSNASAAAALQTYAGTDPSDTATLYPAVQQLEKIMSTDVPEAPTAVWSGLERVQQREVRRMARPVAAVHGSVAERSADALHPDAAQAGGLSSHRERCVPITRWADPSGRHRAGRMRGSAFK